MVVVAHTDDAGQFRLGMERRGWPWKKKSSDKASAEKAAAAATDAAAASLASDNYKKPKYVQISVESYSHLTRLEEQVKTYEDYVKTLEDQINELNEKLSAANSDITTKENLVKQHAKVAEEAVSGWEKAEAEALSLKIHLETVTLAKLTAEDRASHLDGALKECMRQIRNLKEDHEHKLQEVILTKTKQCEKIKLELEAKMDNLEQELLRFAAENAALSRSLQDRSNVILKISEEKSQAEVEIEILKNNIESCEKEINSLKYELHIAAKELEIRNEEKNMSMKSAEVANNQHREGIKKIAKLEAECQRLRGLVKKRLPSAATVQQMRLEVENLGQEYTDTRVRRSPVKPSSPHVCSMPEFTKENEFLTERLLAMEEETKMLKEALAKRNGELLSTRNIYAKTASKLQSLEAQMQNSSQQKSLPSLTSMSEDGNDDNVSCTESWATASVSDFSNLKREKNVEKSNKADNANHLELMDDFLEMEKLACLSADESGVLSASDSSNKRSEVVNDDALVEGALEKCPLPGEDLSADAKSPKNDLELPPSNLKSRIAQLLRSVSDDADLKKILDDVKHVVQDTQHSETLSAETKALNSGETDEKQVSQTQDGGISKELVDVITQIHEFILSLGKEALVVQDSSAGEDGLIKKIKDFSATFDKVLCSDWSLQDFVTSLSHVLAKASELRFSVMGCKGCETEINLSDCIDKVALPENKAVQDGLAEEKFSNGCTHLSDSSSDPEAPHERSLVPGFELNPTCKYSSEEFKQLKSEKDILMANLARCTENLECTKSQLQETEQALAEVKSQLLSAQKMNGLAETQLKCMAESYKSLETRAEELSTQGSLLQAKVEALDNELQQEKSNHFDTLARCKDLQEQLQRYESCQAYTDDKAKQERDLAAAAEKLAECQETIFLLGRQLKVLRPQAESMGYPHNERSQKGEGFSEEPTVGGINLQDIDHAEMDGATSGNARRTGSESPVDLYNARYIPSDSEANLMRSPIRSKHTNPKPTKSNTSAASSTPTPEKRGFSSFFSSKGKIDY
ncbi:Filament-like plant protein [Dillenia turbinata]|uniref:Filament-like plant protein n=1 Tax=Dillenia turbinata TaxID=194707 RepID=A0AAN8VZH7_9MAGN